MHVSHAIKRGVSLYSFQEEYYHGTLDLQGCMRVLGELGIPGVEVIGEQMFNNFPHLSQQQLTDWNNWLAQYNLTPTCHDMFMDTKRFKDRLLTLDEMIASMKRDIDFAVALGISRVRVIVITPPEVTEACAAYAQEKGVHLLLEIHAPWNFQHEWIQAHIAMIKRVGTPFVGLMPDFGIFCRRFPRIITARYVRDGATQALADYVVEVYDSKGDLAALPEEVARRGGNAKDVEFATYAGRYCDVDPREMLEYMPYIQHIQAKFYEMLDDGTEYSVPYDELVPVLIEGGYDGYLSSEYEGNRHLHDIYPVDSVEQVRRHHEMLKRLLGEGVSANV